MFRSRFLALAVLLLGLSACETNSGPHGPGSLSILLTDAPGDLLEAVVTIDKIYLQSSGVSDSEPGRLYLLETPVTANLLDLRNDVLTLVDGVTLPGGTYSQLRLVISGGYIVVSEQEDSEGNPTVTRTYASSPAYAAQHGVVANGTLQMPSFGSSGLKIKLPGGGLQVDGDQQILLLDFNVAESFGKRAGNSGRWVMSPVIRASNFTTTVGVEFSLSLGENVTLPVVGDKQLTLADFGATLDRNGDILTAGFVEKNGAHRANFYFLDADTDYPVAFVEPTGVNVTLNPVFPDSVKVGSGTLRQGFVITAAVPE